MVRFLFQGDSITDCGRDRNDIHNLGQGYPLIMASDLLKEHKGEFEFINTAISGNRSVDLYARMKEDLINLKPDYVSVLIGVNDVWREFDRGAGVGTARYEMIYNMLISSICERLPETKVFILEPFVLKGTATAENWEDFNKKVRKHALAAKKTAEDNGAVFIPLQDEFDRLSSDGDTAYWLRDGVHPTYAGHQVIKEKLTEAFLSVLDS
ncbi:MAG: SGNH/GDSL hydrolase family protein [Acutalibacteraceae bacterium]